MKNRVPVIHVGHAIVDMTLTHFTLAGNVAVLDVVRSWF